MTGIILPQQEKVNVKSDVRGDRLITDFTFTISVIMIDWILSTLFPSEPTVVDLPAHEDEDSPIIREALGRMQLIKSESSHQVITTALKQVLDQVITKVRLTGNAKLVEDLLTQQLEKLDCVDVTGLVADEEQRFRKARKLFVAFCAFIDQAMVKDGVITSEEPPRAAKRSRKRSSMAMRDVGESSTPRQVPRSSAKRRRKITVVKSKEHILLDKVVEKLKDMIDYDEDVSTITLDADPVEAAFVVRQLHKSLHLIKYSENLLDLRASIQSSVAGLEHLCRFMRNSFHLTEEVISELDQMCVTLVEMTCKDELRELMKRIASGLTSFLPRTAPSPRS